MRPITTTLLVTAAVAAIIVGCESVPANSSLLPAKAARPVAPASPYRSPVAVLLDKTGSLLYVAEATANRIVAINPQTQAITATYPLPGSPSGMVRDDARNRLLVTCGGADGKLVAINLSTGKTDHAIAAGHTPMSPLLSPDGQTAYVANRFNNTVQQISLTTFESTRITVPREPVAMALTPDGKRLVVANLLPAGRADSGSIAAAVTIIDPATRTIITNVDLANGASSARSICLSPDGRYAYVTHIVGRYQLPTTQLERGWMNTAAVSIIDVAAANLLNTVLLDEPDRGAANPWGIACTPDGKSLVIAHAGTHELSIIDCPALHDRLDRAAAGKKVTEVTQSSADVPADLTFLTGIRQRIALPGNGPRNIAIVNDRVYAAQYFSDTLAWASLEKPQTGNVSIGPVTAQSETRRGEMLFNDASMCFQNWQSCASCHPDARVDGLNWDLLNDGIGNPKNSRSMLNAHYRGRMMSLGIRDSAGMAVRSGIKFIQFVQRPESDALAIDAYLKSLKPEPSPHLVNGKLSPAAERGRTVFTSAGCATCHTGPLLMSDQKFDLNTGTGSDAGKAFATPTLVELWRTAPYLHDGRSATIRDLLTTDNPADRHGRTSQLSPQQLADLEAFLLSQ